MFAQNVDDGMKNGRHSADAKGSVFGRAQSCIVAEGLEEWCGRAFSVTSQYMFGREKTRRNSFLVFDTKKPTTHQS